MFTSSLFWGLQNVVQDAWSYGYVPLWWPPFSGSSATPETHLFTPSVSSYALRIPFFEKFGIFRPISLWFWQNFSSKHIKFWQKCAPKTLVFQEKSILYNVQKQNCHPEVILESYKSLVCPHLDYWWMYASLESTSHQRQDYVRKGISKSNQTHTKPERSTILRPDF